MCMHNGDIEKARDKAEEPEAQGEGTDLAAAAPLAAGANNDISPASLRRNALIMEQAAQHLAQIQLIDAEYNDDMDLPRRQGRRSGSLLLASERVTHRINWPHMHVQHMDVVRTRAVPYSELKVEFCTAS